MPTYYVVKDRQLDQYAGSTLEEAVEALQPDSPLDVVSAFSVEAEDVGLARLYFAQRNRKEVPSDQLLKVLRNWFDQTPAKY